MKIKEFLDRFQVQTVTGLAPQILGEGTGPEKEVLGRLGQDRAAAGLSPEVPMPGRGGPRDTERGPVSGSWTGRGLLAQNLGSKQLQAAFQVSLPIPNGQGHPQLPSENFLLSLPGPPLSVVVFHSGLPAGGGSGPSVSSAQPSDVPRSAHSPLPGRQEEGVRLHPHA